MTDWLLIRTRRVKVAGYVLYLLLAIAVIINLADLFVGLEGDYRLELLLLPMVPAILFLSRYYHLDYLPNVVAVVTVFVYVTAHVLSATMTVFGIMLFIIAPMVFLFLSNLYIGLLLSTVLFLIYLAHGLWLSGQTGFDSLLYIQGLSIYLLVTALAWLYERDWLDVESRLLVNSDIDFLTQILNRRGLRRMLQKAMADALRYHHELAVIMFEVEDYDGLVRRFGRQTCDQLLIELSGLVGRHVRAGDSLGRWDTQHFMILAPNTDVSGAEKFAEKLRRLVKSYYFENIGHVSACLGGVTLGHDNMEALLEKLKAALNLARQQGGAVHVIRP